MAALSFPDGEPAFELYDLDPGGTRLEIPVTSAAPLAVYINRDGTGLIQPVLLYTPEGFGLQAPSASGNMRRNSAEDCLTCRDEKPCHAEYEIVSGPPLTEFSVTSYPRVFSDASRQGFASMSYALDLYCRNNPKAAGIHRANIFALPFEEGSFHGVYNLGVMEHFTEEEIGCILNEAHRVLRSGGKAVLFWPHARATSGRVLKAAQWIMGRVLKKTEKLHPDEITLLSGRGQAERLLRASDFSLDDYRFGPGDLFIRAVAVGEKRIDTERDRP